MTMHRHQAGELDSNGWTLAVSTEGNFSVQMPMPFNDFTVIADKSTDAVSRIDVIGSQSEEGVRISATRARFRNVGAGSQQFENVRRLGMWQAGATKPISFDINGYPAVEQQVGKDSTQAYGRTLLIGDDVVTLIIEFPSVHRNIVDKLSRSFFDSLIILP
ncbi:hypothetical protein HPT27_09050 [Permianibacter sp. IMCC34836]|uniref:hypothetical protein n=1 Tax=Permianibacter fluminis TaxID=2738515 RepID=UPI0015527B05|nr:hypothetical protein [Permianibacter fluminis]NQD37172.1 hypothetical protein [Permianibacter fluminis]